MTVNPYGIPVQTWTAALPPVSWTRDQIPDSPGVYRLRTGNAAGPNPKDVIYIGKAIRLSERFLKLVITWQGKSTAHGSWKTNQRKKAGYSPANVFCQFKRLTSVSVPRTTAGPWPDLYKNTFQSGRMVTNEETKLLTEYKRAYGSLPILNGPGGAVIGTRLVQYWDLLTQCGCRILKEYAGR